MKKSLFLCLAALMVLAVSCKKDDKTDKGKYGVDGVTPMPEAVDLGLASGVKWASFNLGASKEYEYGDYYAWGETIPFYSSLVPLQWRKRNETDENELRYDWASYLYSDENGDHLTKYCPKDKAGYWDATTKPNGPDGELKLLPTDDVAHVKLGGKWRMPTFADIKELLDLEEEAAKDNSDYTWENWALATDANGDEVLDIWGNVVRGFRVTRKSTGATLFLPAAAGFYFYHFPALDNTPETYGCSWGRYWSSSLYTDEPNRAYSLDISSSDKVRWSWVNVARHHGYPVRPVCVE